MKLDFENVVETAQKRDQFKERLTRVLCGYNIELIFIRWKNSSWLMIIKYKNVSYTLRAKIDLQRRHPLSVSTIKHLRDRVVFWKKIVDERETCVYG